MSASGKPASPKDALAGRLSAVERTTLVKAVESRFGLSLLAGVQAVVATAAVRLMDREQIGLRELVHRIEGGAETDPMVVQMRAAASIGETYFYRGPTQLQALEAKVLQNLVPRKRMTGQRALRIWSAACSTGEEAYTLAILFRLALPDFKISVLGTDMNEASLATARIGFYTGRSVRSAIAKPVDAMLVVDGTGWTVSAEVRQMVTFQRLNLVTDLFPARGRSIGNFDVLVCRNVLIYLDPARIPEVMTKLTASCAPTCVFALTPAEYAAARYAEGFTDEGQGVLARTSDVVRRAVPTEARPPPSAPLRPPPRPSAPSLPRAPSAAPAAVDVYETTLEAARLAADRADFSEAHALIRQARLLRPDSAEPYCLLGTTFNAVGDWQQAVREFQRALYLDRNLAAAELGLGQALATGRQHAEAKRHFERAVSLLGELRGESLVRVMGVSVSVARRVASSWLEDS